MTWIAIKMLVGDRLKYVALVAGMAFAALLITQQASILVGFAERMGAWVRDTSAGDLWVMDAQVEFTEDIKPMLETSLGRVRGGGRRGVGGPPLQKLRQRPDGGRHAAQRAGDWAGRCDAAGRPAGDGAGDAGRPSSGSRRADERRVADPAGTHARHAGGSGGGRAELERLRRARRRHVSRQQGVLLGAGPLHDLQPREVHLHRPAQDAAVHSRQVRAGRECRRRGAADRAHNRAPGAHGAAIRARNDVVDFEQNRRAGELRHYRRNGHGNWRADRGGRLSSPSCSTTCATSRPLWRWGRGGPRCCACCSCRC